MIRLGQKVRDVVTGFEGIAVCRTEWLNGCVRISVQPTATKDKDDGHQYVRDSNTFDEEQLEIMVAVLIDLPRHKSVSIAEQPRQFVQTGGDRPDPERRRDPM